MPDDGTPTAMLPPEVQDIKLQIIGGDLDDYLTDIATALGGRLLAGEIANKWEFDLRDIHITEDDLGFEEMVMWSRLAGGRPWTHLNPLDSDILVCRAFLVTIIDSRMKLKGKKAADMLASFKASEIVDAFSTVVVPVSPLDDGSTD